MKKTLFKILVVVAVIMTGSVAYSNSNNLGVEKIFNDYDRYDQLDKSTVGLRNYKKSIIKTQNRKDIKSLKKVFSTITLAKPITLDEAVNIIKDYNVKPKLVYSLSVGNNGDLVTGVMSFKKGLVTDIENLKTVIDTERDYGSNEFIGITAIIGFVKTKHLNALQKDEKVFLVDISADSNLSNNVGNRGYMHHFGWDLFHNKLNETNSITAIK